MIDYQSNEKITDPNEPNIEVLGNELNEMEDDALIIKIDELQDKLNHLQKDIEKYLSEEFEGDTIWKALGSYIGCVIMFTGR